MEIVDDVRDLIGRTPMLRSKRLFPDSQAEIVLKLEGANPMSVKDRPVRHMITKALADGRLKPGAELVEASSGNTAIAIAMLGASLGFPVRIYMSELCSAERFQILNAFGARVVLTPGVEHTKGARERAIRYCEEKGEAAYFFNQHSNLDNGEAHELTTGPEIWEQTGGRLHTMVIGLGTCGTFEGLSRFFKAKNPDLRIVGFEPATSPVYGGGKMGKHRLIGIGPGFVTDNFQRGRARMDELMHVSDEDAFAMTQRLARTEGILAGVTSGAGLWVAEQLSQRPEYEGKMIGCIICDSGERYLSVDGLFPIDNTERQD
ncbi:MAG: cysteine synthase family protein [Polyangiaceae bacterium]|nr:cysteine synthase family protein [Polyangiaceae bacterium]